MYDCRYSLLYGSVNFIRKRIWFYGGSLVLRSDHIRVYVWIFAIWRGLWWSLSNFWGNNVKKHIISWVHEIWNGQILHTSTFKQETRKQVKKSGNTKHSHGLCITILPLTHYRKTVKILNWGCATGKLAWGRCHVMHVYGVKCAFYYKHHLLPNCLVLDSLEIEG